MGCCRESVNNGEYGCVTFRDRLAVDEIQGYVSPGSAMDW